MSHIDRKMKEKEAVKNSILEASKKIAEKEGWHAVTIRKIAEAIEYTPPIVYEHFENKEDLIRELILSGFRKLSYGFDEISKFEKDPKKLLKKLSLLHWDFAFDNKELYQLMFSLERPAPNEEVVEGILKIKDLFHNISKSDKKLSRELMFNWICLLNGTISTMMLFPPPQDLLDMSQLEIFGNIIDRFINSI
jgi:AcrR family transcriptional regulator